jgi:hypothetical protein
MQLGHMDLFLGIRRKLHPIAPKKKDYVTLFQNSNKPCHFHFTTNERKNPITTFFN